MKKLTDFIVNNRYIVFGLVLLMSFGCIFLFDDIKINRDISKYLPKTSEVRIGKDIMEEEFSSVETSTLNVMFKNLNKNKKNKIYEELKDIDDVEVSYDDSKEYNKGKYTLYVITAEFSADSKEATKLYNKILDKYEDYDISTSGDINEENKEVLPFYIVVIAVSCALVILIIMCDSVAEAFLFLVSIGIAVLLNKGTNIIFGSISSVTDSICSILQMALSMDYSIMLMNRYRQEKEKEKDNVKAMKKALFKAFSSISSSSITTIVGLLALVFMSFTIGRDLGFVLAKGVMFSLFTIFTCLPALILMFDKLINKTKKKSPTFHLNWLSKYSYHIRYISIFLFVTVFIISFLLKGNLTILYTDSEVDDVSRIFETDNQMAIIYNNKYEDIISKYCRGLDNNKGVNDVLCYGNTINEKLTYKNLKKRLKDFKDDFSIDDYLLKIIYYNYYNKNEERMSFDELIKFIKSDVYTNKEMKKHISKTIRKDIDRLENLTDKNLVNQKRNSNEISTLFEIDQNSVDDLLIYYNSLNKNNSIRIDEFINFMNNYILNSKYSSSIDKNSISKINMLSSFINKNTITKQMTSTEISKLFGIDKKTVEDLYLYYLTTSNINNKITVGEFSNFVLNNLSNELDKETKDKITLLNTFSNKDLINRKIDYNTMSKILNINPEMTKQLYLLNFLEKENKNEYTIKKFAQYTLGIKESTNFLDDLDSSFINLLNNLLSQSNDSTKYNVENLSKMFSGLTGSKIDSKNINKIYNLIDYTTNNTSSWQLSPLELVNYIIENKDKEELKSINQETLTNLYTLKFVMESSLNNITYSYEELSNALNLPKDTVKNIYSLYLSKTKTITMSPKDFVTFILNNKNNSLLKNNLNNETINNLNLLNTIMNSTLNNISYSSNELSKLFNIDKDNMNLLYSLYEIKYQNKSISLSYKEFVDFLVNNVITNPKYNKNFTSDKITKIKTVHGIINNSLKNTKYTKSEIFAIIYTLSNDVDKDLIDLLYIYYGTNNSYNNKWTLTIEEFINYLNNDILKDKRFDDFIDSNRRREIVDAKKTIKTAKRKLVGKKYSRVVINTNLDLESKKTFNFIKNLKDKLNKKDIYLIGDSPMSYNLNKTFQSELDFITVLTMIFIFIVVMFTFKSLLIPTVLVLLIQTAVYLTMGILSFSGGTVYFIALLIVQSILMGATIDYAILYTSYYLESRRTMNIKKAITNSYNKSIHTIFTSASILVIVTLIVGCMSTAITAKICKTISEGTLCSTLIILLLLPAVLASIDKFIIKNKKGK